MSRIRSVFLPLYFCVTATIAGTLAYHYSSHRAQAVSLPTAGALNRNSSIVVFAPHCDDETLAAAGLMQMAAKDGADVKIVVMTNGDGFPAATELEYRDVRPTPGNYVRFAEERQRDTIQAAQLMGLTRDDVVFLGYPDRGLMPMWLDNWNPAKPYRSRYTKANYSPYRNSYRPNVVYCGRYLFEDVRSILLECKPTDIYAPHPSDDHPDHAAAYAYIAAAIASLSNSKHPEMAYVRTHTYLIHRGKWPKPMGYKPKASLQPPLAMARLDTKWDSQPLNPDTTILKREAIAQHKSQTRIMRKFLMSFARRNELFGDIDSRKIPAVADGGMRADGDPSDWDDIYPIERDPVGDKILRDIRKAGDIVRVYMCSDNSNLYVRVDFRKNLSKRVTYTVRVRTFDGNGTGDATRLWTATVKPPNTCLPPKVYFAWKNRTLEFRIPREKLGSANLAFVCVNTSAMRLKLDSSGWRGGAMTKPFDSPIRQASVLPSP